MSTYQKNVLVGATMIGALVTLGWMIVKFGGSITTPFSSKQLSVRIETTRADGVSQGSPVLYLGLSVGRVRAVKLDPDLRTIHIDVSIDAHPRLPGNLEVLIRTQGPIGGGSNLVLQPSPVDAPPSGQLAEGQLLKARYVGLDQFLPPEFSELARDLRETSQKFRESGLLENLNAQIARAGELMTHLDEFVSDQKMRDDLRTILDNFRAASESAQGIVTRVEKLTDTYDKVGADASAAVQQVQATIRKTESDIDQISAQVGERLQQIARLLETSQSILAKVDGGNGTAGQFVNDPKLYQALVDSTRELNETIKVLKRLAEQWEQEGVTLKLK